MTEYMHLVGAEDVRSAASTIRNAAEDMRSAANTFSEAVDRQRMFLDEWLQRLEAIMEPKIAAEPINIGPINVYAPGRNGDPPAMHNATCAYPTGGGCTCRAWESGPLG